MHVLHAIAAAQRGGAEQLLFLLGRELRRTGTRVTVLFFDDGPLRPAFESAGIECRVLGGRGPLRPGVLLRARQIVREVGPQVVHLHGLRALTHLMPIARARDLPVVYTSHAVSSVKDRLYGALGPGYRGVEGWFCGRTQAVVATSERMRDDLVAKNGIRRSLIHVIPPCIDLDRLVPLTPALRASARERFAVSGPVVGMIGRLIPVKGHDVLLRALQALPGATALIAGDGPERRSLESLAATLGVASRVVLLGETSDVASVCHASDVVVYPSTQGVIGLAALEAMACGIPLVASDQPGVTAFIERGQTGVLVPPGDADALASAVRELLDGSGMANELADAAMAAVRARYSPAAAAARHVALYETLACATPASAA